MAIDLNIIVPVILFILLSPGLLLNIPPVDGQFLLTGKTSIPSIIVHAIVFAIIYFLLRKNFSQYY
jgi:hypothetical protein